MNNELKIQFASPPDREDLVVELWLCDKMLGEVFVRDNQLMLEIYPQVFESPLQLNLNEVIEKLQEAQTKLGYQLC